MYAHVYIEVSLLRHILTPAFRCVHTTNNLKHMKSLIKVQRVNTFYISPSTDYNMTAALQTHLSPIHMRGVFIEAISQGDDMETNNMNDGEMTH